MSLRVTNLNSPLQKALDHLHDALQSHYKIQINTPVILFLSIGYESSRATVLSYKHRSFKQCWKSIVADAITCQKHAKEPFTSLKIDWVTGVESMSIYQFIQLMTSTKRNYLRRGISFDSEFKQAFLEQEINGNAFIKLDKNNKRGYLDEKNIRHYIKRHRPKMKQVDFNLLHEVEVFTTKAVFYDGETCYPLLQGERDNGRRGTELNQSELEQLITGGTDYLTALNQSSGKFIYGYFSCFDRPINHYNMLRHASTLYSMIEAYELFPKTEVKHAIQRGLQFLIERGLYQPENTDIAYVVDGLESSQREIKLGANAAAILAFTKYEEIFDDPVYRTHAQRLARGIQSLQQQDGGFHHVLHYPSLKLKEEYRIIYYDGEAAFALMRLYAIDQNAAWLEAVEKAFEYFIKRNHWKHHDHWLSYCTNELTIYRPLEKYFKFGVRNVQGKLPYIHQRITTYPTFLELTLAAYQMVQRIKGNGLTYLLDEFNEEFLKEVIHHRAEYQRNGFFYPELAMYYKNPSRIAGSFFIRHHSFRTRIDDVEHYLSGYVHYYKLINNKSEGK